MEKIMSVEERIKRAEERYNKKNGYIPKYENIDNLNKKSEKKRTKKLLLQIFMCFIIYIAFYSITNREYVFSESFRNDVNIFLTQKTKISDVYNNIKIFVNTKILNNDIQNGEDTVNGNIDETDNLQENDIKENEVKEENQADDNIGGAKESNEDITNVTEKSEMEIDADYIKSTISFINPLEGRITSTFGYRNPTVSTVPKYHTGLDIAAVSGTVFKSATDGKVILVSSQGDYGNHYQIQINDVIIIYAHCKKLYLNEGDTVSQGQEIGEVGSTGNSTGPHLHFEIRIEDRKVDPQLILDI